MLPPGGLSKAAAFATAYAGLLGTLPTPRGTIPSPVAPLPVTRPARRRTKRPASNRFVQGFSTLFGLSQAQAGLGSVLGPPSIGNVGGGISQALGGAGLALGMGMGGPGGVALGSTLFVLGKFGEALFRSVDIIKNWSRSLLDSNFQIGEFSGAMVAEKVRQRIRDIQRTQRVGEELAPSARRFGEAREAFMNEFGERIETGFFRGLNEFGANWFQGVGALLRELPEEKERIKKDFADLKKFAGDKPITMDIVEKWRENRRIQGLGRPQRFGQP